MADELASSEASRRHGNWTRCALFALGSLVASACDSSSIAPGGSGGTTSSVGGQSTDGGGPSSSGGQSGSGGKGSGGSSVKTGGAGQDETGGSSNVGGAGLGGSSGAGGSSGTGGSSTSDHDVVQQGVRWVGRVTDDERTRFAWSGTGFVAKISGTGLRATLTNDKGYLFQVVVDGKPSETFLASAGDKSYTLAQDLEAGEHTIELYRQTEGQEGVSELKSLEIPGGELLAPPKGPNQILEVVGDSITCGYGNLGPDQYCPYSFDTESHWDSYSAVAGRALGADVHTIAISGHGVTRNYDGATTDLLPAVYARTLAGSATPVWSFPLSPKVIVINLGTNDFAKGDPGTNFEDEYWNFLTDLRERHPDAFLLATLGPMLNGENLDKARTYIQNAVQAFEDDGNEGSVGFLEYTTQGTGELGCDWHPNVKKHQSMADALVEKLRELKLF
jgi:lysophospholipase L1-like esterase